MLLFRNRWGEQTKTALGDRNQVEEHISPAPATDGAQGTSGGSFVIPGLTSNEYNNVTTLLSAPSLFKGSHYRRHNIKSDIVKNGRADANMQQSHWRGKCVSTSTGSSGKSSRLCTVSVSCHRAPSSVSLAQQRPMMLSND